MIRPSLTSPPPEAVEKPEAVGEQKIYAEQSVGRDRLAWGRSRFAATASATDDADAPLPDGISGPWADHTTRRDIAHKRLLLIADLLAGLVGLLLVHFLTGQALEAASLATLPLVALIMKVGGGYDRDQLVIRNSTLDEVPLLAALAAAYALAWSLVTIALQIHSSRGAVLVLWAGTAGGLFFLRSLARALARRVIRPERVLVVGGPGAGHSLIRHLQGVATRGVEFVGFLPIELPSHAKEQLKSWPEIDSVSSDDIDAVVKETQVDRLVVVTEAGENDGILESVVAAKAAGVKVSIFPSVFEVIGSSIAFDEIAGMTLLGVRRPGINGSSAVVKRGIDVIGSAAGLVLFAPLGAIIALRIKLDSPGPVLFSQPRVGRGGRTFQMIKFRSMVVTAEAERDALMERNETAGVFKLTEDPRVTRTGRWLRRHSLDEMPQLINVLRGEMSLVGPRPLIAEEDQRVEGRHRERLLFSPGMTGPWQVLGPERPPLSEMVKLDYLYGAKWSLWSDLKFILRTIGHMMGRRGV